MSDEHKPHDDHGHAAGHGHDDHAPAAPGHDDHAPAAGHDDHGHGDHGHEAHPAAEAHAHDDAGHGHGHDDHAAPAAHGHDDHGHGHDDHAAAHAEPEAHGHDDHGHAHDAHAAHDDHGHAHGHDDHAAPAAAAAIAAGAASKQPVWSDSGDAPFEDSETTPVYGGRKSKKSKSGGGGETLEIIKTIVFALLIALVLRVFLFQPFTIPSASMEPNLYEGDYIVVSKWSYGYSKHAIPFSPPIFEGRLLERTPNRGDIVVFKLPRDNKTDYIKRLIGLPGDRVQMINNVLHINGVAVPDTVVSRDAALRSYGAAAAQLRETLPNGKSFNIQDFGPGMNLDDTTEFEIPAGYYFMMGDNRDNSVDSREDPALGGVGLVPAENLIGKAEIILFSWSPGASLWNPVSWFSKVRPSRFFTVLN